MFDERNQQKAITNDGEIENPIQEYAELLTDEEVRIATQIYLNNSSTPKEADAVVKLFNEMGDADFKQFLVQVLPGTGAYSKSRASFSPRDISSKKLTQTDIAKFSKNREAVLFGIASNNLLEREAKVVLLDKVGDTFSLSEKGKQVGIFVARSLLESSLSNMDEGVPQELFNMIDTDQKKFYELFEDFLIENPSLGASLLVSPERATLKEVFGDLYRSFIEYLVRNHNKMGPLHTIASALRGKRIKSLSETEISKISDDLDASIQFRDGSKSDDTTIDRVLKDTYLADIIKIMNAFDEVHEAISLPPEKLMSHPVYILYKEINILIDETAREQHLNNKDISKIKDVVDRGFQAYSANDTKLKVTIEKTKREFSSDYSVDPAAALSLSLLIDKVVEKVDFYTQDLNQRTQGLLKRIKDSSTGDSPDISMDDLLGEKSLDEARRNLSN